MALRTKPIVPPDLADLDSGKPRLLPVHLIDEDPEQPRREFDDESLSELAETIRARGVRSPVSVRPHPIEPGRWMLNFGARRLRASKLADLREIPAFIDETFDDYDQVIENEQREGLKPLELALFIKRQLDRGQSRAEIARSIGKSQAYITYACSLIDPPDWLMDLYRSGRCLGMFELHELRRIRETDAPALESWLAGKAHVGRGELQQLRARVAEAGRRKPREAEARDGDVPSTDRGNSMTTRTSEPVHSSPPADSDLASGLVSKAPSSEILKQLKPEGEDDARKLARWSPPTAIDLAGQLPSQDSVPEFLKQLKAATVVHPVQPGTVQRVLVLAQLNGSTVRVVLDELPHAVASVFVTAEGGRRSAVSIDSLADVRLALDTARFP